MRLADLLGGHPHQLLCGDLGVEVPAGVSTDSRRIQRGSLYVAVAGRRQDGHALLQEAFEKGAVAALVSNPDVKRPAGMTVVRVPDTLAAASHAAARDQGEPGRSMKVVSITGTNGKTSIAAMLESILRSLSPAPVGVIGTGGPRIDGAPLSLPTSTPTTPQAVELQAILRAMADRHAGTVVMEASSVALLQHRVDHACTDIGVFTNLSPDHLDDHGTMAAYRQAKMLLFSGLAARAVSNALAAVAACHLLGYEVSQVLSALGTLPQIPGRMQAVRLTNGTTVIVDYAHSADSLEKVLHTLRDIATNGRLITVFGCGGDRDRDTRIPMGSIAGRLSDHVIITSDNPRNEDPAAILDTIEHGLRPTGTPYDRLTDRREAITLALSVARRGDTVLIAGKGSEEYQIIGDRTLPFQDIAVVRELPY